MSFRRSLLVISLAIGATAPLGCGGAAESERQHVGSTRQGLVFAADLYWDQDGFAGIAYDQDVHSAIEKLEADGRLTETNPVDVGPLDSYRVVVSDPSGRELIIAFFTPPAAGFDAGMNFVVLEPLPTSLGIVVGEPLNTAALLSSLDQFGMEARPWRDGCAWRSTVGPQFGLECEQDDSGTGKVVSSIIVSRPPPGLGSL